MGYKNELAYELAQDWIRWVTTRRFFAPPDQKNILAQFLPSPSREAPDGRLSPKLQAFNLAIVAEELQNRIPFLVVYCDMKVKPIKTLAHEIGISRETFYTRAHKTADKLVKVAKRIEEETVR